MRETIASKEGGYHQEMSPEKESAFLAQRELDLEEVNIKKYEEEQKRLKKESALEKLKGLGLEPSELEALGL